ncbi:unnamed protein product [Hydatigera taeniaeformis]|uniref:EF-hand domain-containing protein n=1 Tax=Hydatigena taeniaeformis TaxID=6205 RepID=A0A0R3X317_HYDTA|nr:unnamed protein product [Hydatigera taeniaeformis]
MPAFKRVRSLNSSLERNAGVSMVKTRFYHKAIELEKTTNFTRIEIEGLLRIYDKIVVKYRSPINRTVFNDILFNFFDFTNEAMMERIFRALTQSSTKTTLSRDDWIYALNIFLRGSFVQVTNFAFTVYDHHQRGHLIKEDIQFFLRDVLTAKLPEEDAEELKSDMVDMVIALFDKDKDGVISRKDFVTSVLSEPLLIEVLGECLPTNKSILALESLIKQTNRRGQPSE